MITLAINPTIPAEKHLLINFPTKDSILAVGKIIDDNVNNTD